MIKEIWKQIPDYSNYSVSENGKIRNDKTGQMLNPFDRNGKGYLAVRLPSIDGVIKNLFVHVLVMSAFIGPRPDGLVVNHKDNNPSNNNVDNLHYCTQGYNISYAFKQGRRSLAGEKNNSSKLKESQVLEIRKLRKDGEKIKKISEMYSVGQSVISHICTKRYWKHI